MISKKKSSSTFKTTFYLGLSFVTAIAIVIILLVGALVINLLPERAPQEKEETATVDKSIDKNPEKLKSDTVFITKTVVEKCTKKHCEVEISTVTDPIVEDKQHDSTNN